MLINHLFRILTLQLKFAESWKYLCGLQAGSLFSVVQEAVEVAQCVFHFLLTKLLPCASLSSCPLFEMRVISTPHQLPCCSNNSYSQNQPHHCRFLLSLHPLLGFSFLISLHILNNLFKAPLNAFQTAFL